MMKKKFTKVVSLMLAMMTSFLTVSTVITSVTPIIAEETTVIDEQTTWSFLDDGSDPGTESDRTSWTTSQLQEWKSGTGSFGALKGEKPTEDTIPNILLNQYKDETKTSDIPSYFFRTTVNVVDKSTVKSIVGSIVYSDSAAVTVYLNGKKIAGFNDSDITSNTQYVNNECRSAGPGPKPKGSNEGSQQEITKISTTESNISIWENVEQYLNDGDNFIAVEVHQSCPTNDSIYFAMPSLSFSTESREKTVDNISLSVGSDETKRNFTWYSNYEDGGKLLVAKENEVVDGAMPENATVYEPTIKKANKNGYYSCQTTVTDLENSMTYAYQIVSGDTKTEIKTFKTGSGSSFSFAFAGDPQIGASRNAEKDGAGWEATLNLITSSEQLSDVEFMLTAGDQVEQATSEDQYGYYLNHSTLYDLPVATNVGNHDTSSSAYDDHFNIPNESAYGKTAASGDYYFVYNHVLFMALNSNNTSTAEHKAFMEEAIAATKDQNITWKIVTFHHSIYSVATHATDQDVIQRRSQLSPVFKELDIDVVLMGHDHVYCRTYMMDGETPMTDSSIYDDENYSSITNPEGILYVTANSASGSKYYALQTDKNFEYASVLNQERTPNISRVSISDNQFTITTYRTTDMSVVDTFTINHKNTYNITVDEVENGSASADITSSISGKTITLTASANDGYQFKGWEIVTGNITIENNQFVMPEEDVELKPIFEKMEDSNKSDDSSNKKEDSSKKQSSKPNTSDSSNVMELSIILGISCIGIVLFTIFRKKKA